MLRKNIILQVQVVTILEKKLYVIEVLAIYMNNADIHECATKS